MKHIRKFEAFGSGVSLPVTSISSLTNYYSCDECNALWKSFNEECKECKFCDSTEIEDLTEDEWYELIKSRLEPDEVKELMDEREKENQEMVDLRKLTKGKKYVN